MFELTRLHSVATPLRQRACGLAVAVAIVLGSTGLGHAEQDQKARIVEATPVLSRFVVGDHRRHETEGGPIHVWTPPHYEKASAALVLYVHGYFTTVDETWDRDLLAAQFAASRANAMFVALEGPSGPDDHVRWPALERVVEVLGLHEDVPPGAVIAVGHSGAYRTITGWLDNARLGTVVRLDAAYGEEELYGSWLRSSSHRLVDIAEETRPWAERVHRAFGDGVRLDAYPEAGFPVEARSARSILVLSTLGHHAMISSGRVLPTVLALVVP